MYVLAVDGEDIPLEVLEQHIGGKDIRFYHLDSKQAQEVQLLLNKMEDNTGCCRAGDDSNMLIPAAVMAAALAAIAIAVLGRKRKSSN